MQDFCHYWNPHSVFNFRLAMLLPPSGGHEQHAGQPTKPTQPTTVKDFKFNHGNMGS